MLIFKIDLQVSTTRKKEVDMEVIKICHKHKRITRGSKWIQSSAFDISALYSEAIRKAWEYEADLIERRCDRCKKEKKKP